MILTFLEDTDPVSGGNSFRRQNPSPILDPCRQEVGVVEEEHLLGSVQVRMLAMCSPEHMVSGVTVCPCALIWGGVLTGACLGPLHL